MSIYISCLIAWLSYAFLKSYSNKLKSIDKSEKFKVSVLVKTAFVSYLKKLVFVAAIVYSVFSVFIFLLNVFSDSMSSGSANFFFKGLLAVKSFYDSFDDNWKWITLFLLIGFIPAVIYRMVKSDREQLIKRVVEEYNSGNLEELPETEDMEKLYAEIDELEKKLQKFNLTEPTTLHEVEELELKKEGIRNMITSKYTAVQYLDFVRRLELEIDRKPVRYVKNNFLNSVLIFFTSAGMYTTVKKISLVISTAATSFLTISLLTIQFAQVAPSTVNTRYTLENIVVGHQISELNEAWADRFRPAKPEENKLTQDEQNTISAFSRIVEMKILQSFSNDSLQLDKKEEYNLVSTVVRHNILNTYTQQKQNIREPYKYTTINPFDDLEKDGGAFSEADFGKQFESQASQVKPGTSYGSKMEEDLATAVKKSSAAEKETFLSKMKSYVHSFSEPVSVDDVLSMTYENIYDKAVGEPAKEIFRTIVGDDEIFSKIASGTSSKTFQSLFDNSCELKAKTFVNSFIINKQEVTEALAQVKNIKTGTIISDDLHYIKTNAAANLKKTISDVNIKTAKKPPTITYDYINESNLKNIQTHLDDYTQVKAQTAAESYSKIFAEEDLANGSIASEELLSRENYYKENLENYFQPKIKETYSAGLSAYEDFFPNYLYAEKETPYANILREMNINIGGVPAERSATNLLSGTSEEIFSEAFNFLSLLGNRRIGGVLIGRNPENTAAAIDCRNIKWEVKGDSITISILESNGTAQNLGNFSKDIVAQSIAYAADARPVATTMVKCVNSLPLKIMVHPTLVNTTLGCKIINLDRLVDIYAASDKEGETYKMIDLFQDENLLYNACAYDLISQRRLYDSTTQYNLEEALNTYSRILDKDFSSIKIHLRNGLVYNDTLLSPMRYKINYYNQELVNVIVSALSDNSIQNKDDLFSYVESHLGDTYGAGDILITESEVWSGVREMPYQLTPDMNAFKTTAMNYPFGVIGFIEQVAYKKSIFCTKDINPESDSYPWEFLSLKKNNIINNVIAQNINDGNNKEVITNAVQFILLQRLFRCAFQGKLGLEFPLQKTMDLMNSSVKSLYFIKTPEWNPSVQFYFNTYIDPDLKEFSEALGITNKENLEPCK